MNTSTMHHATPRVTGRRLTHSRSFGTVLCPHCGYVHRVPVARGARRYVRVSCPDLPAGECRYIVVRGADPLIGRERRA